MLKKMVSFLSILPYLFLDTSNFRQESAPYTAVHRILDMKNNPLFSDFRAREPNRKVLVQIGLVHLVLTDYKQKHHKNRTIRSVFVLRGSLSTRWWTFIKLCQKIWLEGKLWPVSHVVVSRDGTCFKRETWDSCSVSNLWGKARGISDQLEWVEKVTWSILGELLDGFTSPSNQTGNKHKSHILCKKSTWN